MKRGRLTTATVAAISIPALGLGVGAVASAAQASSPTRVATTTPAHLFSEQTVVVNCQGRAQVRPGSYTLACADDNDYLTHLSWSSWGPGVAKATGVQDENDCLPYCAAGHFHSYQVNVTFRGSAPMRGTPGRLRYTSVTVRYSGHRPTINGHRAPAAFTMPLLAASS
jgi:hypothetical protein